jgi:hypothetical protein
VSKYFDDSTEASLPGGLTLSLPKLEELEPLLFTDRTFKCGPICDVDHPAESIRERLTEHLQLGCCGPALVVSTSPLVIAVYAEDLDASVLLRFPTNFVPAYGLVGQAPGCGQFVPGRPHQERGDSLRRRPDSWSRPLQLVQFYPVHRRVSV